MCKRDRAGERESVEREREREEERGRKYVYEWRDGKRERKRHGTKERVSE